VCSQSPILDLGPEWESDEEETEKLVETLKKKKKSSSDRGKGQKEISAEKKTTSTGPEASSVIYIGHLPTGFEENEILNFLSQFGNVANLKVSRSKRTGNSRGFAFVQFADEEVAAIVAQTLSGYLFMGEKKLVCHVVPKDKIHPFLFRGVSLKSLALRPKKMKGHESLIKYWQDQHKEIVNRLDTRERMTKITQRLVGKEKQKRQKLADLGIDYDFPGYSAALDSTSPRTTDGTAKNPTHHKDVDMVDAKSISKDVKPLPIKTGGSNEKNQEVTLNPKLSKNQAVKAPTLTKDSKKDVERATQSMTKSQDPKSSTKNPSDKVATKNEVRLPVQKEVKTEIKKVQTESKEKGSQLDTRKQDHTTIKGSIPSASTGTFNDNKAMFKKDEKEKVQIPHAKSKVEKNVNPPLSKKPVIEKQVSGKGDTAIAKSPTSGVSDKGALIRENETKTAPKQSSVNPSASSKIKPSTHDTLKSTGDKGSSTSKNAAPSSHPEIKGSSQISKPKLDSQKVSQNEVKNNKPVTPPTLNRPTSHSSDAAKGVSKGPVSPSKKRKSESAPGQSESDSAKVKKTSSSFLQSLFSKKTKKG